MNILNRTELIRITTNDTQITTTIDANLLI
jgi:hypothetical protein